MPVHLLPDRKRRELLSRAALLGVGLLCAVAACAAPRQVPVRVETLEIDAGESWTAKVVGPDFGSGEVPVLALRQRLQTPAPGGCNCVLQVLLDGLPLTERPLRPRLLNKPGWFDPPGTSYHFPWYGADQRGWNTIFSPSFAGDWGGSGRDYDFLFDLSGLVQSGRPLQISFRYLNPDIPAALGVARAPLTMEGVVLEVLPEAEVERLRAAALQGQAPRAVAVAADLPAGAKAGDRPYQIVWSGRQESPPAQVAFDNLAGWTMQAVGDAPVALSASVEHLLWRPRLARFDYGGGSSETAVELRPPHPIPIAGRWDAVNLWLYGGWDRVSDKPLRPVAIVEDRAGREFEVDLGAVTAAYWGLQHGVLDPRAAAIAQFPLQFTALRLSNCRTRGERRAYLESLTFYQQARTPATPSSRSRPGSFLTSDAGMLPTPPPGATPTAVRRGSGAEFRATVRGKPLVFRVRPERGCFNGVTARWGEGPLFRPLAEGRLLLDGTSAQAQDGAAVVASALQDGRLTVRWRLPRPSGPLEWEADYALQGCTLVVDVRCAGGEAAGLAVGQVAGLPQPRGIEVPYLLMGPKPGPWVACADGLFVSVLADWYHSDCSSIDTRVTAPAGDSLGLMRGTVYDPLTDGRRNPLHDRVLVTASPEFADTLPNARNPQSPNRARLAPYLFFMSDQMNPELYRALHRYGLDRVIANDFGTILSANHYAEGFAARWRPHPSLTLQQVQEYRRCVKDLGYLFGTYQDVTDYYPGSELWDESKVALTSDGDFLDGWWGNYVCKPAAMPEIMRAVGRESKRAYPSDCVYLDVHTNRGPQALDLEAGAPGAGIAREEVLANGDCILEARKAYGATVSEGLNRWMYAGLTDMDYATIITAGTAAAELPPLVDFDLLKIHPFQNGTMMGHHPDRFISAADWKALEQDTGQGLGPDGFYKYVSASLAYGHMLVLGYWYIPPPARFIHYYALMQGVQSEYLGDTVESIRYHDGTSFVSTSRALAEQSQQLGRVCVRYSRGLTVYVNYNGKSSWQVTTGGRTYDLPPYGWVIEKPGSILAFSALRDGRRLDYVRCPEYCYLNTGGARAAEGPLEVAGAAWLKREGRAWRLIPCGDLGQWERVPAKGLPEGLQDFRRVPGPADRGCSYLAVDIPALLRKTPAAARVVARDEDGRECPAHVRAPDAAHLQIEPSADAADYVLQ